MSKIFHRSLCFCAALAALGLSACCAQCGETMRSTMRPRPPVVSDAPVLAPVPLVAQAQEDAAVLQAGSSVRVDVAGEDELSGAHVLAPDGSITLKLVGRITLAGKTPAQAEDAIAQAYRDGYLKNPRVQVTAQGQGL